MRRALQQTLCIALLLALTGCASSSATSAAPPSNPTVALPRALPTPTNPQATPTVTQETLIVTQETLTVTQETQVATTETEVATTETPQAFVYVFPLRAETFYYPASHHDYPAADIFCPIGSEFVAPTSGVVDWVTREDLYDPTTNLPADRGGLSVALIGDDGVRYYGSHLSTVAEGIEPGVRVMPGQLLGLTGKSGNAKGTDPHLHFGISRPTTPDDWQTRRGEVWPQPYLDAWQRGEQVTPVLP